MVDPSCGAAEHLSAEQPPPPLTAHRRPRAREVSSRFMSPMMQSNSTPLAPISRSDFQRSKSVLRQKPSRMDENHFPEKNRSSDKSSVLLSTVQRKQRQQRTKLQSKENRESNDHQHSDTRVSSRTDTPTGSRFVLSRYRQDSVHRSNPLTKSCEGCAAVTAAARLLQEATSDVGNKLLRISTLSRDDMVLRSTGASNDGNSFCSNSPRVLPNAVAQIVTETRSSLRPDVDEWREERSSSNADKVVNVCARSLNLLSSLNMGVSYTLPPHPLTRQGFNVKKGKRACNHQEDVHSLKILSNHYLQWRFTNAKGEVFMKVQTRDAERKFYSLCGTLSDIHDRVKTKRNELAFLRRNKTLTTVVKAQMPWLDEWTTLEEEYSKSLSGTTNALLRSAIRIPVNGDVRADVEELKEALASALKVLELIGSHTHRFMTRAEEIDISVSELAKMFSKERVQVGECGDLLSKTYMSQAEELSLRSSLMQCCNRMEHHTS